MKIISAEQAAHLIKNGDTVACAGFVSVGHAEGITSALEHRFETTQTPRDLTLVYSAGQGDRGRRGVNHFGNAGMTRKVIGGHWLSAPRLSDLVTRNQAQGFNLPQGVISHLYRAIAGGKPGVITKIGLHTFVDPRNEINPHYLGGRLSDSSTDTHVEHLQIKGDDYLLYPSFPIHVALIRGTTVDDKGNITCEHEAFYHDLLAISQAAHNSGGLVIAQVKRQVAKHANPFAVRVPGILVDYVVISEVPEHNLMTFAEAFNPHYLGLQNNPPDVPESVKAEVTIAEPLNPILRRILQRRAALEIAKRQAKVVNLGVGVSANVGNVAGEMGIGGFTLTVESGPIGGVPAEGLSFGASAFPEAIVDQSAQFDFYEGGGIDLAFLGMAELDENGNINVSKFGVGEKTRIAGVGGFINISQSAKAVVFMGAFKGGSIDLKVDWQNSTPSLSIHQEGTVDKVIPQVAHLSFNGRYVAEQLGIQVLYITERAVFEMRGADLTLIEIAPGLDVQRDVLQHTRARIKLADEIKTMDARVFE